MSVKVAVRVRPFNQREKDNNATLCIQMQDPVTSISDPSSGGQPKEFTFDYSFWSYDGFDTDANGYNSDATGKYADQNKVYSLLGKQLLDNAWDGYHCCLFAYGQTGAGKSYSMVGYGANKGIVPIATDEIFKRITANTNKDKSFEVNFSMLEIYNEKVQDLLIKPAQRPQGGLKVREHQSLGVYVEGIKKEPVASYTEIEKKMDEGYNSRTVGATMMNATSSRAHTVITIEFKQIELVNGRKVQKLSVINLVDLAGSEKTGEMGVTGDRLKEGCAINKSLTVLGQVISVLADKAMGKGKGLVIPYRDSQLTRILQNALGGNSKTIMICALSPASINYEETLSTLRYAERAKKIQNKAIVNESEQDKLIRELRAENERLKKLYNGVPGGDMGSGGDPEAERKVKELEDELKANMEAMKEYEKSWQQKLEEAKQREAAEAENKVNKNAPHISNLSEDSQLNEKVLYSLEKCPIYVGRKNGDPAPQIVLGGIGIKANHATFESLGDGYIQINPADKEAAENVFVNGEKVTGPHKLKHCDRIIFGTNTIFIFKDPPHAAEAGIEDESALDWEYAQKELVDKSEKDKKQAQAEMEAKMKEEAEKRLQEMEQRMQEEKAKAEEEKRKKEEEYLQKIKDLEKKIKEEAEATQYEKAKEEAMAQMKVELEKMENDKERKAAEEKRKFEETELAQKRKEQEHKTLLDQLDKYMPMVNEANLSAKELKRNANFSIKLVNVIPKVGGKGFKDRKTEIAVQLNNNEEKTMYQWSPEKFENRLFMIRDLVDNYFENGILPSLQKEEDPFWDPPEPQLIGEGFLTLKPLSYLLDSPSTISLLGTQKGGIAGKLKVNLLPVGPSGEGEVDEDLLPEEPKDLIGQRVDFRVIIDEAQGLPEEQARDVYCVYEFYLDDKEYETHVVSGKNANPKFNYSYHHTIDMVTDNLLNYLNNDAMRFRVYGSADSASKKGAVVEESKSKPSAKEKVEEKKQTVDKKQAASEKKDSLKTESPKKQDSVKETKKGPEDSKQENGGESVMNTKTDKKEVAVVGPGGKPSSGCCNIF